MSIGLLPLSLLADRHESNRPVLRQLLCKGHAPLNLKEVSMKESAQLLSSTAFLPSNLVLKEYTLHPHSSAKDTCPLWTYGNTSNESARAVFILIQRQLNHQYSYSSVATWYIGEALKPFVTCSSLSELNLVLMWNSWKHVFFVFLGALIDGVPGFALMETTAHRPSVGWRTALKVWPSCLLVSLPSRLKGVNTAT
eukprot:6070456-Amphidinium_carterae.1